jgi:hypothetical protein
VLAHHPGEGRCPRVRHIRLVALDLGHGTQLVFLIRLIIVKCVLNALASGCSQFHRRVVGAVVVLIFSYRNELSKKMKLLKALPWRA